MDPWSVICRAMRFLSSAAILTLASAVFAIGCCGGGADDRCRATLSYKGGTNPGAGSNKVEAQQGACWKYCIDRDPDVEAAYQRWLAGNKAKGGGKTFALEDVPTLKTVRLGCESQCQRDLAAGKGSIVFSNCK
jgi:hypothetical protein